MSIKTIRKRIAIVAVSALGASLISVAAAPQANAAFDATVYSYAAASSTGVCAFGAETNDTTRVGEVLVNGVVNFTEISANSDDNLANTLNDYIEVSWAGPAVLASLVGDAEAATDAAVSYPSASSWRATNNSTGGTGAVEIPESFSFRMTAAGSVQITISTKVGSAAPAVVERYTFTVSAACATGTAAPTNSLIKVAQYGVTAANITDSLTDTEAAVTTLGSTVYGSSADKIENGGTGYIAMLVKDPTASANNVTTQGIFSATATNGVAIGWDATQLALGSSSATTSGPATGTAQSATLSVTQGTANTDKPVTTTITLSFNGVVYGVRTLKFTGKPTAINITGTRIAKASGAPSTRVISYEIVDSAGNKLTSEGSGADGVANFGTGTSENNPVLVTSATVVNAALGTVTAAGTINTEASGYAGTVDVTCTKAGQGQVTLKYTFSDLSSISSAPATVKCGGSPVNYKASMDKASYIPGEIATLTISATDEDGLTVYDRDGSGVGNDLGDNTSPVAITIPGMTAVTTPTNTDEFLAGVKTYQFTVNNVEGAYNGVVSLPLYNSTTYAQANVTVSYKIAPATSSVTNAEVLSAIVKLIASINKQIRALQKRIR